MADPPSSNPEKGVKFLAGTPDIVPSQPAHLNAPAIRPSPPVHADSTDSLHPGLKPEITAVPVTPGLELGGYEPISGTPRPSSGYFPSASPTEIENSPASKDTAPKVSSEAGASRTANASAEVPRGSSMSEIDQVSANPSLGLSGGVISATFCIPYSLEYQKSANWVKHDRRGTSALFDSFHHLATKWNHTLVGWTGEIKTSEDITPPVMKPGSQPATRAAPLNRGSAPIPVDGAAPEPQADGVRIRKEDQVKLEQELKNNEGGRIVPVWLADDKDTSPDTGDLCLKDQSRWRRFAEDTLYTIFHYKQNEPGDGRAERKSWADYFRLNQKFANRILEVYKPGDIVMIHDYHLLLLPSILRQKVPHMYIAFFLHVPFPSSEFMRCVPQRKEILEGVLGANLCGFQSYSYSRHFVSCCTRITGFESDVTGVNAFGAKVMVGVFPIGINVEVVEKYAFSQSVDEKLVALQKLYAGKKLIVGRDRLDTVRGVYQKLQAFERFLELYPEWREKVVLVQVTSPSNMQDEKEENREKVAVRVSEMVQNINGLYGSLKYTPVQHYPQYLAEDEYFALLRAGDIGLITSVRDGMSTTSLEYILCQLQGHGPLILSEFSGTAGSLRHAIHINPWDLTGVAKQLHAALSMSPEDKKIMHGHLYEHVKQHNGRSWTSNFLKRLLTVLNSNINTIATPLLDKADLVKQYRQASKRLFMFDYDGTLTPIVGDPAAAIPSERLLRTLKALAMDEKNDIWVISGRDQEFLTRHLGHISNIGFSAEHGSFLREPGSSEWVNLAAKFDMTWQKPVLETFQKYTDETPGSFIERKRCALTWHYRASETELGLASARACQKELLATVAKEYDVEVMTGKANLEVRPTFINKGSIASRLVESYGATPPEFILCLGDDFTDEDMFRALNNANLPEEHIFTCVVGPSNKPTLAKWHLLEPRDVIMSLGLLNGGAAEWTDLGSLSVVEGHVPDELPGVKIPDEMPGFNL